MLRENYSIFPGYGNFTEKFLFTRKQDKNANIATVYYTEQHKWFL